MVTGNGVQENGSDVAGLGVTGLGVAGTIIGLQSTLNNFFSSSLAKRKIGYSVCPSQGFLAWFKIRGKATQEHPRVVHSGRFWTYLQLSEWSRKA